MLETLSLAWDAHKNNICSGLSVLQQRGEFVDMTLAADGHHVKVHKMVMSLVSPYIKDLISSAECPHPVIFLNNISYTTLCAILEYIYTGEVVLPKDKLPDLLAAGKALHIKGLREMESTNTPHSEGEKEIIAARKTLTEHLRESMENKHNVKNREPPEPMCGVFFNSETENDTYMELNDEPDMEETIETLDDDSLDTTTGRNKSRILLKNNQSKAQPKVKVIQPISNKPMDVAKNKEYSTSSGVQYSISNQGGLQVIINRYIYNLKYVQKNLNRYWRCVDYAYKKCPANVYTNDKNEILKRKCTHNHPFHDSKILKKVHVGLIFTAYNEAETRARDKKTGDTVEIIQSPSTKSILKSSPSKATDTE